MQIATAELKPPALNKESLTEQTASVIRESILNGTYALGQKLREIELARRLGVSGSVVREALHLLQGEGIVVAKPYCGRFVFDLKPEEVAELRIMRASLESYAAYLAAQKMTPEMAVRIMAAAERFSSEPPVSYTDWVDRELGFHRSVWEASRNEWLIHQLMQFSIPTFAVHIRDRGGSDVAGLWQDCRFRETPGDLRGHQSLARAIVGGAAAEARRLMVLHVATDPSDARNDVLFSGGC